MYVFYRDYLVIFSYTVASVIIGFVSRIQSTCLARGCAVQNQLGSDPFTAKLAKVRCGFRQITLASCMWGAAFVSVSNSEPSSEIISSFTDGTTIVNMRRRFLHFPSIRILLSYSLSVFNTHRQVHATAIAIPSVCLSVRPSVRLVIHTQTVFDIEIGFAPYHTMLFDDSSHQIS